ncbi:hypothetical protein [Bacillus pumilus]|uniref:hypothetical protein n=1 Tax=Bacillus pumilus TaxID=1408 RepID=UPI001642AFE0|nr:hypothetical protein [Bacillus pumilus]
MKKRKKAFTVLYFYPANGSKNNGVDGYYGPKTTNMLNASNWLICLELTVFMDLK